MTPRLQWSATAPRIWWSTAAFLCISLHFTVFHYISLHFSAFICISLHSTAFLCISLHFSSFLCISLHSAEFPCISLHFTLFLFISQHFPAFICIFLHFSAFSAFFHNFSAFYILDFRTIVRSVPSSYGHHFFVLIFIIFGWKRIFFSSMGVEIGKRIFLKCIEIGKVPNVINDHQPAPKEAIKHKLHSWWWCSCFSS